MLALLRLLWSILTQPSRWLAVLEDHETRRDFAQRRDPDTLPIRRNRTMWSEQ